MTEDEKTLSDIADIIGFARSRMISPQQALVDIRAQLDIGDEVQQNMHPKLKALLDALYEWRDSLPALPGDKPEGVAGKLIQATDEWRSV
jgi:hypothetical protein